jgi:hypothetical protein
VPEILVEPDLKPEITSRDIVSHLYLNTAEVVESLFRQRDDALLNGLTLPPSNALASMRLAGMDKDLGELAGGLEYPHMANQPGHYDLIDKPYTYRGMLHHPLLGFHPQFGLTLITIICSADNKPFHMRVESVDPSTVCQFFDDERMALDFLLDQQCWLEQLGPCARLSESSPDWPNLMLGVGYRTWDYRERTFSDSVFGELPHSRALLD